MSEQSDKTIVLLPRELYLRQEGCRALLVATWPDGRLLMSGGHLALEYDPKQEGAEHAVKTIITRARPNLLAERDAEITRLREQRAKLIDACHKLIDAADLAPDSVMELLAEIEAEG
jgi:hypothetical protein